MTCTLEMATAQRTRSRAVVGAPHSVATKICITSQHQRSAAYKIFFTFFLQFNIVGDFLFMNNNG